MVDPIHSARLSELRLSPTKVPPGFGSRMAGRPSQFGVDEEDADAAMSSMLRLPHVELAGFHIYSGTQCLNAEAIAQNFQSCAALFTRLCEAHHLRAKKLIFGSGFGIPYHDQDRPLDLSAVATIAAPALDALRVQSFTQDAEYILETGRYLVGEAGVYLTRVVSTKRSRGVEIRICDGGMNHHLGAAGHLGSVLHRNYRMFKLTGAENEALIAQDLFGPLCTSIDILAKSIQLPSLSVGDIVCILCSGAYGPTASPAGFISHDAAKEVLVERLEGRTCILDASVF